MCCGIQDGQPHIFPPLQAMRRKCLDCCCGSSKEVRRCPVKGCALWPFRFGKDPRRRPRPLSQTQLEALKTGRANRINGPAGNLSRDNSQREISESRN